MKTLLIMALISLISFAIWQRIEDKNELRIIKYFTYYAGWFFAIMAVISILIAFLA
jgi:uncharacterized membrane protein